MNSHTIETERGTWKNEEEKAIKQKGSKGEIKSEIMASLDAYAASRANK